MLRTCPVCGRIHDSRKRCASKRAPSNTEAARFRSTYAWQRKRDAVRERDLNLCRLCLDRGEVTRDGLGVHHIVPLEESMEHALDDDWLITLCSRCHEEAERGDVSRSKLRSLVIDSQSADNPPGV